MPNAQNLINSQQSNTSRLPKNADEHIARLREQLIHNSECGTTHYNLAVALIGKKEYQEAERILHDAIDCSPTLAEAYVLLGGICLQRNDLDGCYRFNQLATKARAGFAEGYGNMGFVLLQLIDGKNPEEDENKVDMAIKNFKKAIIYNKNFLQAYTTLGTAYFMKGLLREAIESNLEAVKIYPDFPIAHNNLAVTYLELKEYNKAIQHCDEAVRLGFEVNSQLLDELAPYRN